MPSLKALMLALELLEKNTQHDTDEQCTFPTCGRCGDENINPICLAPDNEIQCEECFELLKDEYYACENSDCSNAFHKEDGWHTEDGSFCPACKADYHRLEGEYQSLVSQHGNISTAIRCGERPSPKIFQFFCEDSSGRVH